MGGEQLEFSATITDQEREIADALRSCPDWRDLAKDLPWIRSLVNAHSAYCNIGDEIKNLYGWWTSVNKKRRWANAKLGIHQCLRSNSPAATYRRGAAHGGRRTSYTAAPTEPGKYSHIGRASDDGQDEGGDDARETGPETV